MTESVFKCKPCNKKFRREAQFEQHVQSKKHKLTEAAFAAAEAADSAPSSAAARKASAASPQKASAGNSASASASADDVFGDIDADGDAEADDGDSDDESAALLVTACLFCSHQSASLEENVAHMTDTHSFFVPYVEYLQDLSGFIQYLGYKVGLGRVCLYCNGRGRARFASVTALQQHMVRRNFSALD